jgi:Ca-activated chloride channel family protein
MRQGIISALRPLRKDAQRQVVLITDGLIGFESEVVQIILEELPTNSRLHTVGIGSSVNRSLTSPAARAGKGVEMVVGIDESPQDAIRRLLARTTAPLITDLAIQGSALLQFSPEKIPDLFAESPVLILLKIKPQGGKIDITGKTRKEVWYDSIEIPPIEPGTGNQAHIALFGREYIEDLEMRLAAGEENRAQIEQQIQQIGLIFQIPSRFTSWIAVSNSNSIDPLLPRKKISQPHKLSYGVSAQSMGLRKFASVSPSIHEYLNSSTKVHKPAASTIKTQSSSLIFSPMPDSFHTSRVAESPVNDSSTDRLSRIFKGRIVFASSRKLILEAIIDDKELCWATPTQIRLICRDGTNVVADIDLESSTPAKVIDKGQLLKIVLHLRPRFSTTPKFLVLRVSAECIAIDLCGPWVEGDCK